MTERPMRILHTADWHLGKRLGNFNRFEEQQDVLSEICEIAEHEAVDAVIIAGDIYDSFNPTHDAEQLLYETLMRLTNNGNRAVVLIAGNHDSPQKIENPTSIALPNGIIPVGYPDSVVPVQPLANSKIIVNHSMNGFVELVLPLIAYPLRLLLTPYANAIRFKKALQGDDTEATIETLLARQWGDIAASKCDETGINLLMAHLFMMQKGGVKLEEPEDERSILHIGGAEVVFAENVPSAIQYVALGHLHRYQKIAEKPCPIIYPGSPLAYSMSEADQQKMVVVLEAKPGQQISYRPVPLTKGKRLKRGKFNDVDAAIDWLEAHRHCFVEVIMETPVYLSQNEIARLNQAHEKILKIIPKSNFYEDSENLEKFSYADPSESIERLFDSYFKHVHGQEPGEDIRKLFNEIVNDETEDGDEE
jgi:exonuclease SbcD